MYPLLIGYPQDSLFKPVTLLPFIEEARICDKSLDWIPTFQLIKLFLVIISYNYICVFLLTVMVSTVADFTHCGELHFSFSN